MIFIILDNYLPECWYNCEMFRYFDILKTLKLLSQCAPVNKSLESWLSTNIELSISKLGSNGPATLLFVFSFSKDGSLSNANKLVIDRSLACQPFTPIIPERLMLIKGSANDCCINDLT